MSRSALLVLFFALASSCREPAPPGHAERVILITCDTLRFDRLGMYGYPRDVSPHLDFFARQCLVFDKAYSTAPLTGPSMSALFAGRLPDELGVSNSNKDLLPAEAQTFTEVLRDHGVPTAAIVSNWVLRIREGVEEAGVHQGFDHFDDEMNSTEANRADVSERIAEDTTNAALDWIADRPSDRFFLWVHYQDPHGPYTAPEAHVSALDRPLGDEPALKVGKTNVGRGELPAYQVLDDERHPETYRIRYDAEIRYFDKELARLLDGIGAHGLDDGAMIIFTSDHGEALGDHNHYFSHGHTLFDELVHVPFLVRYPPSGPRPKAVVEDGYQRVPWLVDHMDLWPTILEAFGIAPPPSRGTSLFAHELDDERVVVHHLRAPGAQNRWLGITSQTHRLLTLPGGELLFDVAQDPGESINKARSDRETIQELRSRYEEIFEALPALQLQGTPADADAQSLEELEKLGYGGGGE